VCRPIHGVFLSHLPLHSECKVAQCSPRPH
jgi:hypothetical protein